MVVPVESCRIRCMKKGSKNFRNNIPMALSRAEFEEISAIEGVRMSSELSQLIQQFIDDGLSHDQCRTKIMEFFKAKSIFNK